MLNLALYSNLAPLNQFKDFELFRLISIRLVIFYHYSQDNQLSTFEDLLNFQDFFRFVYKEIFDAVWFLKRFNTSLKRNKWS